MGCSASKTTNYANEVSKHIDNQIERQRKANSNVYRLLLIGTAEGGKSTIVKQMRIIHGAGYTSSDRIHYRNIVHVTTIKSLLAILAAMEKFHIHLSDPSRVEDVNQFSEMTRNQKQTRCKDLVITREMGELMIRLWHDECIQRCFHRSREYQLNDSAGHFLNNLHRLFQTDYIPTEEDVLKSRVQTIGVNETQFYCKGSIFKMIDVGGQRSERRKWLHCFYDVEAVIFCVALSEYDTYLAEDCRVNRMMESMELFDSICNNKCFKSTSLILFLNKTDLLMEKIRQSPLSSCFPDYDGPNTYEEAVEYIKAKFKNLSRLKSKVIYTHLTCAINTQNIQWVFDIVSDLIIKSDQRECALY